MSFLSNSQSFADNFKLMGEGKVNEIEELNGIFYAEGASDLGFQNIFANDFCPSKKFYNMLNFSRYSLKSLFFIFLIM